MILPNCSASSCLPVRAHTRSAVAALAALLAATLSLSAAPSASAENRPQVRKASPASSHSSRSSKNQPAPAISMGYASYYARKFIGRLMADGTPMKPESDNAASLHLPLGSKALVTNLKNGRTAVVTIRDRGPFIKGRIIDVSPSTANMLGMVHAGVAQVSVVPYHSAPRERLESVIAAAEKVAVELHLQPSEAAD